MPPVTVRTQKIITYNIFININFERTPRLLALAIIVTFRKIIVIVIVTPEAFQFEVSGFVTVVDN
jgi:hypothetical protein